MSASRLFIVLLILILSLFQATSASNYTLNHNHNFDSKQEQNSTRKPILIPEGPLAVFVRLAGLVGILIMGMR